MTKISVRPELLDFAAIRADGLIRDLDASASAIRGVPMAGLEPSTRARTAAAIDYASGLTTAGAKRAAGQGREYRRRVALAHRADSGHVGGGRPSRWGLFTNSLSHPDGYTKAGLALGFLELPHKVIEAGERHRKFERKWFEGPERKWFVGKRKPVSPNYKPTPGLGEKGAMARSGKALSRGLTVINAAANYKSGLEQGRSESDAAAKSAVTTAAGYGATAAGVAIGGFTGPAAVVVSPVLGAALGGLASWGTGSAYDALRPVKPPRKLKPMRWPKLQTCTS